MTFIADEQLATGFLASLAGTAIRTVALAGFAGIALAGFRVKTTSVRLFTWTAVLYAALAMPLLERMLPSSPLPVPAAAFLQSASEPPATKVSPPIVSPSAGLRAPITYAIPTNSSFTPHTGFDSSGTPWTMVASAIYFAIVFLLLGRLFVGLGYSQRLRRASLTIHEPRINTSLAAHGQREGLSGSPHAAESTLISVPVTMGVLRPTVFLPATWRDWDDAKLDAVIAHEVSHVARRDTLTQRLSFLHCTVFWFSPLAWWLNQHLADLMEQASDEAALAGGADRKVYATTLLSFFEALQTAPGRVWWQGVAMAAGRSERRAQERFEKILDWKGAVAMRLKKSMVVAVVVFAVPVVYLTASARPARQDADSSTSHSQNLEIAQNPNPTPSPRPSAARGSHAQKKSSNHSSYSYGYDDNQSFVIVSGQSDSLTMSGTRMDGEHVQELRKTIPGDFIWFKRGEKSYVIRDQATVNRAKAFWAPQEDLGKKQEELGKQQEELGKQQEELGKRMEQIQVKVPDLTQELEKLQAKLKELSSGATVEQVGELQSEIGDLQSKIGDVQSQAGDQQSKLGDEMGALGEKQGKLGSEQGELGRQQGELAQKATQQMKMLLDEAIAKGTAQVEP